MDKAVVRALLRASVLALLASGSCACVAISSGGEKKHADVVRVAGGMSEAAGRESSSGDGDVIAPEEVGRRLLKFIGSIKGPKDFSWDRLRKLLGMPSPGNVSETTEDGFAQDVPGTGWTQSLNSSGDSRSGEGRLEYWLDHEALHVDSAPVNLQPICAMSFGAYRDGLVSMGFLEGPSMPAAMGYDTHGTMIHTFDRDGLVVDIQSRRKTQTPIDASFRSDCILSVQARMWTGAPVGDAQQVRMDRGRNSVT